MTISKMYGTAVNSFNSWIKTEMAAIIGNNTNIIRELFE